MNLHQLTGTELNRAKDAADYLCSPAMKEHLDPSLQVKLDTLRADLLAEQEERRNIARH